MSPRVVIAHDFCELYGGAERVTAELAEVFPDAPVVAILGRKSVARRMGVEDRISFVLPSSERLLANYRMFAPLYFGLVKTVRLPPADLLISSNFAYVQGLRPPAGAPHLCYSWGPFRHLWSQAEDYAHAIPFGRLGQEAFSAYVRAGRVLDQRAAQGVDLFATSSSFTEELLTRTYGRPTTVVPPPINCTRFHPSPDPPRGYFLFVGRLVEPYKRPSMVIEAFNRMPDLQLKIAGVGPELDRLKGVAGPNVEFLGHLEDPDLIDAMQHCDATVIASVDDFGLVPLEVNACGRPVIAFAGGGPLLTVKPGVSGEFFHEQSADALASAVRSFNPDEYDTDAVRLHAKQWDRDVFHSEMRALAERLASGGEVSVPRAQPEPA